MKRSRTDGFGAVEIILFVVMIGIVSFVGFRVYEANLDVQDAENSATTPIASSSATVPVVNDAGDLDKVESMLDEADSSTSFEQELDTELAY